MKRYGKVAGLWLLNALIVVVLYVVIAKLDLTFRRDESFASSKIDASLGCVADGHTTFFASSSLLLIDYELSGLSVQQINTFDDLVTTVLEVPKKTSVLWWIKGETLEAVSHMLVDLKFGGATRGSIAWNGCSFSEFWGQSVDFTYIDMQYGLAWSIGSLLHERAHSYRAVHGYSGVLYGAPVDNLNVTGPHDAYWWTAVGFKGATDTCVSNDLLLQDTCEKVQVALAK